MNRGPSLYKSVALPTELRWLKKHNLHKHFTKLYPYRICSGCMTVSPFSRNSRQPPKTKSRFVLAPPPSLRWHFLFDSYPTLFKGDKIKRANRAQGYYVRNSAKLQPTSLGGPCPYAFASLLKSRSLRPYAVLSPQACSASHLLVLHSLQGSYLPS